MTFNLKSKFLPKGDQLYAINSLLKGIKKSLQYQILSGVPGSGKTFTIANIIKKLGIPTVIITHNKVLSSQLYREMKGFFPSNSIQYFISYYDYYKPEAYLFKSNMYIKKKTRINQTIEQMRLSAIKSIVQRKDTIIVSTVSAIYGIGDPNIFLNIALCLKSKEKINQRKILQKLSKLRYKRSDSLILERGDYRVSGDVIDIFPADHSKMILRIELLGNIIENIFLFDPIKRKKSSSLSEIVIFPKHHFSIPKNILEKSIFNIKKELKIQINKLKFNNQILESERLEERTNFDIEMIQEFGYCLGIENYSRYFTNKNIKSRPSTIFDYFLDKNFLLVIDESHITIPQIKAMYKGELSRKKKLIKYGFRLPSSLDNRPLKFSEFENLMQKTIFVSSTPGLYEKKKNQNLVEQIIRPTGLIDPKIEVRSSITQKINILNEIKKRLKKKEKILITTLTKKKSELLTSYLKENNIKVNYIHSGIKIFDRLKILQNLYLGNIDVLVGINLLREGLDIPTVSLVAIFDADKKGFLRSYSSLIQIIGRASRNLSGKAILYANTMTDSIKEVINEIDRRRNQQISHNIKYDITPKGVKFDKRFFDNFFSLSEKDI